MAKPTRKQIEFAKRLLKQRGVEEVEFDGYTKAEVRTLITEMVNDRWGRPITPAQVEYIAGLAKTLGYAHDRAYLDTLDVDQGHEAIEQLKEEKLRRQVLIYEDVVTNGRVAEDVAEEWDLTLQQLQYAICQEEAAREKAGSVPLEHPEPDDEEA